MKILKNSLAAMILLATLTGQAMAGQTGTPGADRVLSIGGAVTEIIYALDQDHRLIARDTTSVFPPRAAELPDVGYMRALSPEGVLSVAPSLILSVEGAGPPEAMEVLQAAGIPIIMVPAVVDGQGIADRILQVGAALGAEEKAEALAAEITEQMSQAHRTAQARAGDTPKRVLFILSAQGGRIMAGGTDTAADAVIRLAGAVNAATGFEGYKPMTDEAVTGAAPDVILMMDRGGDHAIADDVLLAMPALVSTPAARDGAVVRMNGLYLLGFGPRTAQAVSDLSTALYGE